MRFNYDKFNFNFWDSKYKNDLLFIAVSGSHAYGWTRKDSDLDIKMVWIPKILQALSIRNRGRIKEGELFTSKKHKVEYTNYPLHHFLGQLAKGNGNALENLFQEKLICKDKEVKEIQELTMENLHTGFLKHYKGYSGNIIADMENPNRKEKFGETKGFLAAYRVISSGLILHRHREVIYNVRKQLEYIPMDFIEDFLNIYLEGKEISNRKGYWKTFKASKDKLFSLRNELKEEIDNSKWYDIFPIIVFDRWIYDYFQVGYNVK